MDQPVSTPEKKICPVEGKPCPSFPGNTLEEPRMKNMRLRFRDGRPKKRTPSLRQRNRAVRTLVHSTKSFDYVRAAEAAAPDGEDVSFFSVQVVHIQVVREWSRRHDGEMIWSERVAYSRSRLSFVVETETEAL